MMLMGEPDHTPNGPSESIEDFRVVREDGVEVPFRTRERKFAEAILSDREARGRRGPYRIQRRVTVIGEWEDV